MRVQRVLTESDGALLAIGHGTGSTRAADAARMALASPLLETGLQDAKGVLLTITGRHDLALAEINEAAAIVAQAADPVATIIFGAVIDPRLENEVKLTLVATGSDRPHRQLHGGAGPRGGPPPPDPTLTTETVIAADQCRRLSHDRTRQAKPSASAPPTSTRSAEKAGRKPATEVQRESLSTRAGAKSASEVGAERLDGLRNLSSTLHHTCW